MTIKEYFETIHSSAPYLVMGLLALGTVYGKYFNLQGRAQFLACFGTGCFLGTLYYLAILGVPGTVNTWAFALLTVILTGLFPSGVYNVVKAANQSALKAFNK